MKKKTPAVAGSAATAFERSVTSSSNIARRKFCPGSHHAEAECLDVSTEAADAGTLLHPFAINPNLSRAHLTDEQRELLETADHGTRKFISLADQTFGQAPRDDRPKFTEHRLVLKGPDGEVLFDGQIDEGYSYHEADAVAVLDHKMGFVEVTAAEGNYQAASYAVIWTDHLQANNALVGINQPRKFGQRLTTALYDKKGIEAARIELAAIYHAAQDKNAPRIAGEVQCAFCKAKLHCDEYKRKFRVLDERPDKKSIATVPTDQLIRLAEGCKFADRIKDEVMAEVTARIQSGEITDWYLKENGSNTAMGDSVAIYQALAGYFGDNEKFTAEKFTGCMTLSFTKLVKYFREITEMSEPKAKGILSELLADQTTRKPKNPTPTPKE